MPQIDIGSHVRNALLLCSGDGGYLTCWFSCEVRRVADSSLAGHWSSGIDCGNGCGLRDVQRGGGVAPEGAGGDVEQRVVSAVGICRDQLHAKLGVRMLCRAGVVDWSVLVDELSEARCRRNRSSGTEDVGMRLGWALEMATLSPTSADRGGAPDTPTLSPKSETGVGHPNVNRRRNRAPRLGQ